MWELKWKLFIFDLAKTEPRKIEWICCSKVLKVVRNLRNDRMWRLFQHILQRIWCIVSLDLSLISGLILDWKKLTKRFTRRAEIWSNCKSYDSQTEAVWYFFWRIGSINPLRKYWILNICEIGFKRTPGRDRLCMTLGRNREATHDFNSWWKTY